LQSGRSRYVRVLPPRRVPSASAEGARAPVQFGDSVYCSLTLAATSSWPLPNTSPRETPAMIFLPRSAPASGQPLLPLQYVILFVVGSMEATFVGSTRSTGQPGTGVPSAWKAYTCVSLEPTTS